MAVESPERVFYIGNHPQTGEMYLPLLKFLATHPNTALVAGKIWAFLPKLDVIPVEVSKYYQGTGLKHKVEHVILSLLGNRVSRVNVVEEMAERIHEKKNVLIFPAGKPAEDGGEQPWRPGVAKALLQTQGDHPSVAFVHIHDGTMDVSDPIPAEQFIASGDPASVVEALHMQFNQLFMPTSRRS